MSSDSELDEFYDAEDVTPNKSVLEPVSEKHGIEGEDLDDEEQELLRLQRLQEERRRKEDEELQKRLQQLRVKKREEKEKKLEQEKKEQLEKRRRKHEELRRRITEKGDNSSDTSSSSAESDFEDFSEDSPDGFVEKAMNNTSPLRVSLPVTVTPPTSGPDPADRYGDNINSSQPEKEKPNKQIYDFVTDKSNKLDTIDHNMIDAENIVENVLQETHLLNTENEPDIVKSTKTRTPPNTLQTNTGPVSVPTIVEPTAADLSTSSSFKEPVAPPRRKKKLKLNCADEQNKSARSSLSSLPGDGPLSTDPQSPGLPSEHALNPNAQFEKLTKDLEHSLDLQSIVKGKKHIKAQDAEMNAVNTDQDSPHQTLESTSGTSKSSSLEGRSSDSKHSKTSSLERSSKHSKTSSLDREAKKSSKTTSLERRKSKSSSLEKEGKKRSRHISGPEVVRRKESMNRPRSPSGKTLTDEEILEAFMVKNLDTGESVPLKDAEVKIQKCMDPLVLHILERTNDQLGEEGSDKDFDTKSEGSKITYTERALKKKGKKLKKLFGKTVSKVKSVKDQMMHGEDNVSVVEEDVSDDGRRFKFKANHNKKGPYEFGQLQFIQDLSGEHTGAVWVMKFSPCGRLLATGGQDSVLTIWVLDSAFSYFDDMRQKYVEMKVSPAPSQESLTSLPSSSSDLLELGATAESEEGKKGPFKTKPFCKYRGHTADLLDISWSKNYFILSSSMDKTVRLWHISRRECLCTFQHIDFVTAIVFHPRDDRYFLSGSLDGKLRLWNIPDKKVTLWNEVGSGSLITTANFCHNGKFAVVGTYDGKCIFYSTEHLKYYTQIHVRSTRGKNSRGRKITSIEPLPGEDKVLVTSNDSRVRLYDLRDLTLACKYKGHSNTSSQIRASFSPKGKYVISGSEDHFIYLWKTQHEFYKFSSARRDRNDYYEAVKVHNAVVTSAVFAPNPLHFQSSEEVMCKKSKDLKEKETSIDSDAEFLVSADFLGCIKVIRAK